MMPLLMLEMAIWTLNNSPAQMQLCPVTGPTPLPLQLQPPIPSQLIIANALCHDNKKKIIIK